MARFKNYLLVVIGFAFAGMIGAAFGTGTAQAVVSTLVSVVNPSTNPVQTNSVSVTDPGRIAYQATVAQNCSSSSVCIFSLPSVAAGHRVVVQHVAGAFSFDTAPAYVTVYIRSAGAFVTSFEAPVINSIALAALFDQPVLFYIDSGNQAQVRVTLQGGLASFSGSQPVALTGYELDCTVAACAPIATQ